METVQAFVGCLLDLGATRRVMDLARATRKSSEAQGWKARWVPPPNVHITLKFLGDIDPGLVSPLSDALAVIARKSSGLRLSLGPIGAFPSREDPKVLFVEVSRGFEPLAALATAVEEAMYDIGFPREKRAYHPHVTIARVQSSPTGLGSICPANMDCGQATLGELTLYRSDLLRAGVEYHALARFPLGADTRELKPDPRPR